MQLSLVLEGFVAYLQGNSEIRKQCVVSFLILILQVDGEYQSCRYCTE